MLPELVRKRAQKSLEEFCREFQPSCPMKKEGLSFDLSGQEATIYLEREVSQGRADRYPVALLRYAEMLGQWTLFSPHSTSGWRPYLNVGPSLNISKLLTHLREDPFNTFWP